MHVSIPIKITTLKPLRDRIFFKFLQETYKSGFINKTDSGLLLATKDSDPAVPRWGKAVLIGPEVKNIKVDDYILITPLMWTENFLIDGEKYWITSQEKVLLSSTLPPDGII